jgi:hypothetical protein
MIHSATCKCARCFGKYSNGNWSIVHSRGDVIIERAAMTPADALSASVVLECAAKDAQDWRDWQLADAGIGTPPTLRSVPRAARQ